MTRPSKPALALAALLVFSCLSLEAQKTTVALLGVTNRGGEPRHEYLAGIIQGIMLYDMSSQKDVEVVDRAHLEDVLKEQELRLSAVMYDQGKALEIGKILGADFLLSVDYVFLGEEIQANATLTSVATAKAATFSERGSTENTIHALSERVIQRLNGKTVALRSPQRELSILSLEDETPGSIALYAGLVDAEIFLDGEFAGYSGQDVRSPFVIETVKPGPHSLRIHLSRFGVMSLPDFTFHDWEQRVEVKPGRRQVVRANAAHINEIIYKSQRLLDRDIRFAKLKAGPVKDVQDLSFTDRQGNKVSASLEITATASGDTARVEGVLVCGDEKKPFQVQGGAGEAEIKARAGKIELSVAIDPGWSQISYSVIRTDIWQNMDMEESP
jgi:hypothetical protein